MYVKDKIFLVTGAGSGMGRELVLGLLANGCSKVAAVDIHDATLQETKQLAGDRAKDVYTYVVDISSKEAVEKLPKQVTIDLGSVDAIINNAGIIQPFVKVNNLDYDVITRVMNVNFFGPLFMIKSFLPLLFKRPEAHIVNVSSMGGFLPVPGQSVYGASKAAIKLLSEGLYSELANTKVHVSVVFPGAIQTNITSNSGVKAPVMPKGSEQKFKALEASGAAKIIISGIEKNKPRIFVGSDSKMMNRLYRLNPQFATNLITKQMKSLLTDN